MPNLRRALRNEYVQSAIFLAIILGSIIAFWFGLRAYSRTEYPLLAVASGSMVPTLKEGDLIVVQGGLEACEIKVGYYGSESEGDVIVFHTSLPGEGSLPGARGELIVHRAVEKFEEDGEWFFRTQGDYKGPNARAPDPWEVPDGYVVGKVVWSVPYLGRIPLFVHTRQGMLVIVILIVILVLLEFIIPSVREKKKPEPHEEETGILGIGSI